MHQSIGIHGGIMCPVLERVDTSTRLGDIENGFRAAPGKSETRATVAIVVNDAAPVAQAIAAQTDSRATKRSQSDALAQNRGWFNLQDAAALCDDR